MIILKIINNIASKIQEVDMRKTFSLIFIFTFLFLPGFVFSQHKPPTDTEKMQQKQKMDKMRQDIEKHHQDELETLKKTNPQLYQKKKNDIENKAKIKAIVASFREGKISSSQAESQLSPLVKQQMQDYIKSLDDRIARLQKKLDFYKKAKVNPDLLIKKRIDELLGKSKPSPEDFMD